MGWRKSGWRDEQGEPRKEGLMNHRRKVLSLGEKTVTYFNVISSKIARSPVKFGQNLSAEVHEPLGSLGMTPDPG